MSPFRYCHGAATVTLISLELATRLQMKLLRQIIEAISCWIEFRCGNDQFDFRADAVASPRATR